MSRSHVSASRGPARATGLRVSKPARRPRTDPDAFAAAARSTTTARSGWSVRRTTSHSIRKPRRDGPELPWRVAAEKKAAAKKAAYRAS